MIVILITIGLLVTYGVVGILTAKRRADIKMLEEKIYKETYKCKRSMLCSEEEKKHVAL